MYLWLKGSEMIQVGQGAVFTHCRVLVGMTRVGSEQGVAVRQKPKSASRLIIAPLKAMCLFFPLCQILRICLCLCFLAYFTMLCLDVVFFIFILLGFLNLIKLWFDACQFQRFSSSITSNIVSVSCSLSFLPFLY